MKFQIISSLIPFTLWFTTLSVEVSLSNILMISLFHSNNRMVIFSKIEKNLYQNKRVKVHTFMTCTWKENGDTLTLICHMVEGIFIFKQKIYWYFFVVVINVWPLNDLNLQPIQSLEGVVSSSTSSHKSDTFWLHREQPPAFPSIHSSSTTTVITNRNFQGNHLVQFCILSMLYMDKEIPETIFYR